MIGHVNETVRKKYGDYTWRENMCWVIVKGFQQKETQHKHQLYLFKACISFSLQAYANRYNLTHVANVMLNDYRACMGSRYWTYDLSWKRFNLQLNFKPPLSAVVRFMPI